MVAIHRAVFHKTSVGEVFEVLRTGDDTAGAFVEYEWTLTAASLSSLHAAHHEPSISQRRLHSHPFQTETVQVLEGELMIHAGNDEIRLKAGDVLTLPPGTPHRWLNTSNQLVRSRVVLRPALEADLMIAAMGSTGIEQASQPLDNALASTLADTLPPGLYLPWPERPVFN